MKRFDLLEGFAKHGIKPKNYVNGFSEKTRKKLIKEFLEIEKEIMAKGIENFHVVISEGNMKLGEDYPSVSLRTFLDCGCNQWACGPTCYDQKDTLRNEYSRKNRVINYLIWFYDPERYFEEISLWIKANYATHFRFHVGGDIIDTDYFYGMIEVAMKNPQCVFLCYTKQYDIVNLEIQNGIYDFEKSNLKVVFSAYEGLVVPNPYGLPVSHILYADGHSTCKDEEQPFLCLKDCRRCNHFKIGCAYLKHNESVVFALH